MTVFRARVQIAGRPSNVFHDSVPDMAEELEARPYWKDPRVVWDAEGERVIVDIGTDLKNRSYFPGVLEDDLSDIVSAVIAEWEDYDIQILHVAHEK